MPIQLVTPRSENWADRFRTHRDRLGSLLPGAAIEHIGSTAIGGISSKDVVDILVGVDADGFAPARDALTGYIMEGDKEGHMWFCWPDPSDRQVIVHVVKTGSRQWSRRIKFRDRLRENPALAAEYAALRHWAARQTEDWTRYTELKTSFVRKVLGEPQ